MTHSTSVISSSSSAGSGHKANNNSNEIFEIHADKMSSNFAVICEQESLEEVEMKKLKKKNGWKRLLSPHKLPKTNHDASSAAAAAATMMNQTPPFPSRDHDSDEELSETKLKKKHESRWR